MMIKRSVRITCVAHLMHLLKVLAGTFLPRGSIPAKSLRISEHQYQHVEDPHLGEHIRLVQSEQHATENQTRL